MPQRSASCAPLQTPFVQVLPGMQPPAQLAQEPPVGMLRGMHIAATQEEHQVLSTQ